MRESKPVTVEKNCIDSQKGTQCDRDHLALGMVDARLLGSSSSKKGKNWTRQDAAALPWAWTGAAHKILPVIDIGRKAGRKKLLENRRPRVSKRLAELVTKGP